MPRKTSVALLALMLASCASGAEDQLATDACEVLEAHRDGELSAEQVSVEFVIIVDRAAEMGADVDIIEAQIQVQCLDALDRWIATQEPDTGD